MGLVLQLVVVGDRGGATPSRVLLVTWWVPDFSSASLLPTPSTRTLRFFLLVKKVMVECSPMVVVRPAKKSNCTQEWN